MVMVVEIGQVNPWCGCDLSKCQGAIICHHLCTMLLGRPAYSAGLVFSARLFGLVCLLLRLLTVWWVAGLLDQQVIYTEEEQQECPVIY